MRIIERFTDWFKDKNQLIDENMKIRKGKFDVEQKYNEILEDLNEMSKKYTSLLEQKSERFDLYVKYQDQCEILMKEKRDLKKELAKTLEDSNASMEWSNKLQRQNEKLNNKIKRLEKKNEQST